MESRYNLIQLRVTNYGGGVAHDISLKWDKPLVNSGGKEIRFTKQDDAPEIPILLPNESMSTLIDGSMQLFQKYQDMNYAGLVEFKDASGKKHKHQFQLSIEKYRGTLTFAIEEPKTHHELQKIPQEIQRLVGELRAIRSTLQANYADEDQQTEDSDEELLTDIEPIEQSESSIIPEETKAGDDLDISSTETQPQQ